MKQITVFEFNELAKEVQLELANSDSVRKALEDNVYFFYEETMEAFNKDWRYVAEYYVALRHSAISRDMAWAKDEMTPLRVRKWVYHNMLSQYAKPRIYFKKGSKLQRESKILPATEYSSIYEHYSITGCYCDYVLLKAMHNVVYAKDLQFKSVASAIRFIVNSFLKEWDCEWNNASSIENCLEYLRSQGCYYTVDGIKVE